MPLQASMIGSLNAGKFDLMMDGLAVMEDRAKVIALTKPYAATPAAFVADRNGTSANLPGTESKVTLGAEYTGKRVPSLDSLRAALKGKTIGIQLATAFSDFIDKNFRDVATIREYKTAPEHDLDLAAGRIDLAFDDVAYFASALGKPENKDLIAIFDTAIKAAIADGTVSRLSTKWFKVDVTPTP